MYVYSMCRCTMCAGGVPYVHHSAQCCEVVHTVQCAPRSVVVRCSVHCAVCIVHCIKQCTAVCIKQCSGLRWCTLCTAVFIMQCAPRSAVVRGGSLINMFWRSALLTAHSPGAEPSTSSSLSIVIVIIVILIVLIIIIRIIIILIRIKMANPFKTLKCD